MEILCCGEALIDMLPNADGFTPVAGGAVFNTAIGLGRLGVSTGFFSGLSTDFFGDMLRDQLQDSGVDHHLAINSNRPTTLAFVRLNDGQAQYAFYDENTAGRMLQTSDLPALPASVKALFFGGISLVSEPCANAYEVLMTCARQSHVTMIDPNIRPDFITDEATYRARIERMLGLADIVKLSDEDLHWLRGNGDMDTLAQGILSAGAKLVLITQGAKGATGYSANAQVFAHAIDTKVKDTIGAGDAFNAGILATLQHGGVLDKQALENLNEASLHDAIKQANRVAAITVSRAGANPPWAKELT